MILIKTWEDARLEAYPIRKMVFIEEQGVPESLELDEFDSIASHALAYLASQCVGTARLIPAQDGIGYIGRMAVLRDFRKQGIGRQLLQSLIELSKAQGFASIKLHAQLTAIPFYERLGFVAIGNIYDEAGIAHRDMILDIYNNR